MNNLENLSISELSKQLEDSEPSERRDILKSVFDKSTNHVENYAKWGEVLNTENHDGLSIGDEVRFRNLYFRDETGYIANFFQTKSPYRTVVKPVIIPRDGVEYSIPLQNSVEKID